MRPGFWTRSEFKQFFVDYIESGLSSAEGTVERACADRRLFILNVILYQAQGFVHR